MRWGEASPVGSAGPGGAMCLSGVCVCGGGDCADRDPRSGEDLEGSCL